MIKISHKCSFCGETNPANFYGHKKTVCSTCHNEYTIKKGREKRDYIIHILGGKCSNCGFDRWTSCLEVHHVNQETKDTKWIHVKGWSKKRIDSELEKGCILLCSNCHHAFHSGELNL